MGNLISLKQPTLQIRQQNISDAKLFSELRTLVRDIERQFTSIAVVINDSISGGTASILNGTTSIAITHGMSFTPAIQDISFILTGNATNDPGNMWVSSITSTQFTINCRNDPGVSNLGISWQINRTG